jgi:acetyltransferase-like isoleucine patch superfamily enzyme
MLKIFPVKHLWFHIRFDWPLHFSLFLTNWLPDNVIFLKFRGWLIRPFVGSCGSDLEVGRNVYLYNPSKIHIGNHVYFAFGSVILADTDIFIEDEVMLGPYCVLSSSDHTCKQGSFRFAELRLASVRIGRGAWLGAHAIVTAGSIVGSGSVVGAGAVVTAEVPCGVFAAGIPARVISTIQEKG